MAVLHSIMDESSVAPPPESSENPDHGSRFFILSPQTPNESGLAARTFFGGIIRRTSAA